MNKKIADAIFYISIFGTGYVLGKAKGFCKGFAVGGGIDLGCAAYAKHINKEETNSEMSDSEE